MSNFPDLLNIDQENGGENFWPSLTDIMMVVVMIFLISTTTLIIKNWALVKDLTATIEAERSARQTALAASEENMTLEERVAALESLVSQMQLKEMKTREEKAQLESRLERLITDLSRSDQASKALQQQLEQKGAKIREQLETLSMLEKELNAARDLNKQRQQSLDAIRAQMNRQTAALNAKETELTKANEIITSLRLKDQQRSDELSSSREKMALSEENLNKLREQFQELESKYNKLVRPARTTKGKIIVATRMQKIDGVKQYAIKMPQGKSFEPVDEATLQQRLAALKAKYGDKLYVRIVFPDNNGLSYKEAYSFTTDILNKYDYYHQQ